MLPPAVNAPRGLEGFSACSGPAASGAWDFHATALPRVDRAAFGGNSWLAAYEFTHQEDVAVTLRFRSLVSLGVGLWMAQPWAAVLAQPPAEPARLNLGAEPSGNQRVAEAIGATLRQSGRLHGYRIDVTFQNGVAELSGQVASPAQREEALRLAQGVRGVERVIDLLTVAGEEAVRPAQAQQFKPPMPRPTGEPSKMPQAPPGPPSQEGAPVAEPTPIFQAPPGAAQQYNPPRMPPYAWPTYAPYNNYSRVGYPSIYPYESWPFIGPMYPFPKIPLGWRSVCLTWQDGTWWYGRRATGHDWWRIRYW
jgi:hypothetical protein